MQLAIILSLVLSNAGVLFWALKFRMKKHEKVDAIASVIRAFERNGEIILKVEKMDPAAFFLRSPQR